MATHRQELVTQSQTFNFSPRTLEEAEKYAMIIANSGICPQALKGRPNDVLVILQLGYELKLKPMQALRSLGCINGVPFAWGDGQLALVKNHPDFIDIKEWMGGTEANPIAYCTITRRNQEPQTREFSKNDAILAGLWNKPVWKQYPKRMLQHRARSFACRDVFPDALFGLMSEDEAVHINSVERAEPIKAKGKGMAGLEESLGLSENIIDVELVEDNQQQAEPEIILTKEKDIPQEVLTGIDELKALISRYSVSGTSIKTYLKRCGVKCINDLNAEQIDKWSNHLKLKETA